ncbi:hypothetical protein [Persicobacter diffluens]|uniref:Uncharacterized protein n=1 Tax=Persicobacter diffluens TaxID=981 RepID=A0AAN4W4K0_9BACT|nr:hypothetical protein PEDI_57050 [Persicobacter diffluens]
MEVHKERIAEEFNQYWKDLCFQYYNQLGEDCLDDYLEYLQNEAPALERKSLSSWEMQTPSEEAIRFFGRYLIKNFGTPQERLYQVKGLKAYAKKVYQFDVDAF